MLVSAQRAYDAASAAVRQWHFAHPKPPSTWTVTEQHQHDDLHAAANSALMRLHMLRAEHGATGYYAKQLIEREAARPGGAE